MTSVTWDRHRGHAEDYDIVDLGFNYRLDEPRAALGLSRLPRLGADIEHRRAVVKHYRELLDATPQVIVPWSEDEVELASHFGFPIVLGTAELRTRVERELDALGVQTTCYPALTSLSAYSDHPRRPLTEDLAARHLLLPLSSTSPLTEAEIVVGHLLEVLSAGRPLPTR
jgi:dTDP-4-amino-4,6-dideoxygalactose transaminase